MTLELPTLRSGSLEPEAPRLDTRARVLRVLAVLGGLVWLWGLGFGIQRIWAYQGTPGTAATAPARWPGSPLVTPTTGRSTLIMFVHPGCSCTRASLAELKNLLATSNGRVAAWVLFLHPPGTTETWERTATWSAAKGLRGVQVLTDTHGREADRFGASTSGQVVLYGDTGRLLFAGGITGARGHVGDNTGRAAVSSLVATGKAELHTHAVYGCGLHDPHPRTDAAVDTTT